MVGATHVVHGDNVGMVEAGRQPRLGHEPLRVPSVGDHIPVRDLDRDVALEFFVETSIDDREPAAGDFGENAVSADRRGRFCGDLRSARRGFRSAIAGLSRVGRGRRLDCARMPSR